MTPDEMEQAVREALEDLKAVDIVSLEVSGLTTVTDYMVIATGTSGRHVRALADHVDESVRERGGRPMGVEGMEAAEWVLMDLGDVLVHLMQREAREFYDLEKLWSSPAAQEAG